MYWLRWLADYIHKKQFYFRTHLYIQNAKKIYFFLLVVPVQWCSHVNIPHTHLQLVLQLQWNEKFNSRIHIIKIICQTRIKNHKILKNLTNMLTPLMDELLCHFWLHTSVSQDTQHDATVKANIISARFSSIINCCHNLQ